VLLNLNRGLDCIEFLIPYVRIDFSGVNQLSNGIFRRSTFSCDKHAYRKAENFAYLLKAKNCKQFLTRFLKLLEVCVLLGPRDDAYRHEKRNNASISQIEVASHTEEQ